MAEEWNLPGVPRKGLVRKVKSVLFKWLRCRPHIGDPNWKLAWKWANDVAYRNHWFKNLGKKRKSKTTKTWPSPEEIACQYLFIVLTEMRTTLSLRLPYHASEFVPKEVVANLEQIAKYKSRGGLQLDMSKFKVAEDRPMLTIEELLKDVPQIEYTQAPEEKTCST